MDSSEIKENTLHAKVAKSDLQAHQQLILFNDLIRLTRTIHSKIVRKHLTINIIYYIYILHI